MRDGSNMVSNFPATPYDPFRTAGAQVSRDVPAILRPPYAPLSDQLEALCDVCPGPEIVAQVEDYIMQGMSLREAAMAAGLQPKDQSGPAAASQPVDRTAPSTRALTRRAPVNPEQVQFNSTFDDAARGAGVRLGANQHYLPATDAQRFMSVFGGVRSGDGVRSNLDVRTLQRDLGMTGGQVDGRIGGQTITLVAQRFLEGTINLPASVTAEGLGDIIRSSELLIDAANLPPEQKQALKQAIVTQLADRISMLPAEQMVALQGLIANLSNTEQGIVNQQGLAAEALGMALRGMADNAPERLGALARHEGLRGGMIAGGIGQLVGQMDAAKLQTFATAVKGDDSDSRSFTPELRQAVYDRARALATEVDQAGLAALRAAVDAAGGGDQQTREALQAAETRLNPPADPAPQPAEPQPRTEPAPRVDAHASNVGQQIIAVVERSGDMGGTDEGRVLGMLSSLTPTQRLTAIAEMNDRQWAQLVKEMDGSNYTQMLDLLLAAPPEAYDGAAAGRIAWAVYEHRSGNRDLVAKANERMAAAFAQHGNVSDRTIRDWAQGFEAGGQRVGGDRGMAVAIMRMSAVPGVDRAQMAARMRADNDGDTKSAVASVMRDVSLNDLKAVYGSRNIAQLHTKQIDEQTQRHFMTRLAQAVTNPSTPPELRAWAQEQLGHAVERWVTQENKHDDDELRAMIRDFSRMQGETTALQRHINNLQARI